MTSKASARLTCLCGTISESGTLLSDPIPISTHICHCDSCRYTTGALAVSFPLTESAPSQETVSKLKAYHSSVRNVRYFCSTCGCHCFVFDRQDDKWYCLSGMVEEEPSEVVKPSVVEQSIPGKSKLKFQLALVVSPRFLMFPIAIGSRSRAHNYPETVEAYSCSPPLEDHSIPWPSNIVKTTCHQHVHDTVDGGIAPALLDLGGRLIPAWSIARYDTSKEDLYNILHSTVLSLPVNSIDSPKKPEDDSLLKAECHCGGVSLSIKRADWDPAFSARYIPSDHTKYLTYLCACRSCRLSTGVSLVSWTLVSPGNIFTTKTSTGSKDSPAAELSPVIFGYPVSSAATNPGLTLKHYWSSPDVCRSFCGECGATVSYWCGQRPHEVDIAVGILRAQEGSMARKWLEWEWGRCSFPEECVDQELLHAWSKCAEVMKSIKPGTGLKSRVHLEDVPSILTT